MRVAWTAAQPSRSRNPSPRREGQSESPPCRSNEFLLVGEEVGALVRSLMAYEEVEKTFLI